MKCLVAGALLLAWQAQPSACTLKLPSNHLHLNGRLAGINLLVKHGAITHLRTIVTGWSFQINNDPSWNTTMKGEALVGAAFLDINEFSGLISITPEPNYNCAQLAEPGMLRLTINSYYNDKIYNLSVGHVLITK